VKYYETFAKGNTDDGWGSSRGLVPLTVLTLWDTVFLSFGYVFFLFAFKKKENEPGDRGRAPLKNKKIPFN